MTNKTAVDRADSTPVKVIEQGFPVLSAGDAWVSHRHDDIALVNLDMQTKWCTVSCISSNNGVPSVMIEGTDRATQIVHDRGMTDDDRWTEVEFPEFAGWDIEMAECRRYTVQVLFTKMKPDTPTDLLKQAYIRGQRDGYALGLRDGQLTPEALKAKHESMKTWVPKRRTDKQDWGVPAL